MSYFATILLIHTVNKFLKKIWKTRDLRNWLRSTWKDHYILNLFENYQSISHIIKVFM